MNCRLVKILAAILVMTMMCGLCLAVGTPRKISYQGRATDASGTPLTDGNYAFIFRVYDHPTAGTQRWTESATVGTVGGLFTHLLGNVTPIPDSLFANYDSLYLQVTVAGQNMLPRNPIVSTGYAMRVNSVDGAKGGDIDGRISLVDTTVDRTFASIRPDASGNGAGYLQVSRDGGGNAFYVDGNYSGTGEPYVQLNGADRDVIFNMSASGSSSIRLPVDAIEGIEILDEPGIACAIMQPMGYKMFTSSTGQTALSVSITTPADGYIVVEAKFRAVAVGMCRCAGWVQIDETAGGSETNPYASRFGQDSALSTSAATEIPGYISRVYYKTAGAYTFLLEGGEGPSICGSCTPQVNNVILLATYYPTSYGSVATLVTGADAGQFENAKPVEVDGQTMFQVDLRDLELRATRAQLEAEKLQRQLLLERLRQEQGD